VKNIKIDITLRSVISKLPHTFIRLLTNKEGKKLLDTALPEVKDKRADLIVEMEDKSIFHLEVQSLNDKNMAFRMLEYFFLIREKFKTDNIFQMVLYVGKEKLNMTNNINLKNLKFNYSLKDIREINCSELLNSQDFDDKILAVLCNIENESKYINSIIFELLKLEENKRKDYIKKLFSISRYRPKIDKILKNEIKERIMPIVIDLKNDPYYNEGKLEGKLEGKIESAITFIKDFHLPIEEVSKKLHIPISEIKKYLDNSKLKEI